MPRRTGPRDLRRRTATRPERRTIVVFCEGEASEPDYLAGVKALPEVRANTAITIVVDRRPGMPRQLVERAVTRSRDDEVDECWCLFDVEAPTPHPDLREAVQVAHQHGIRLAISNPCFELWLILHLRDHSAWISTADTVRLSRRLDGRPGKRIDPALYLPHRRTAVTRANRLSGRHTANSLTCPDDNPSSDMSGFLAAVEPPEVHA